MWFITMRLSHQNAHMCLSRCPVCIWSVLKLPCVPLLKSKSHWSAPPSQCHPPSRFTEIFCWFLQIALFPSSATSVNQLVTQFWKPSFQVLNVAELLRILKICFYHDDDGNISFILMTMKFFWPDFENPQRPRWSSTPLLAKLLCWIHLHKINIRFSTNRKKTSSTRKTVSKWSPCFQRYICILWNPWGGNANILSTHPKVFSFCPQSTGSRFHSWNWNWNISYWHNIE